MRIAVFDVGGTTVKYGLFDTEKGLLQHAAMPSPLHDAAAMADAIANVAKTMDCERVGVATAGAVNLETGLITASNLYWEQQPLREMLQQRLQVPVWVDNDAKAALMAEWYDGACRGMRSAVYLVLGTGVGGALLIDGKPYKGHDNTAVELGHMMLYADGDLCACGQRGCMELYCSTKALERLRGGRSAIEILQGVRTGDAEDTAAYATWIDRLGAGLTNIVRIFSPQAIVLGGGISGAGDVFLQAVRAEMDRRFAEHPEYYVGQVYLAQHGNDAGLIGAAVLALQNL